MNTKLEKCENGHPPIEYDFFEHKGECPLCKASTEVSDLEEEVLDLKDEIEGLEGLRVENEELEGRIEDLKHENFDYEDKIRVLESEKEGLESEILDFKSHLEEIGENIGRLSNLIEEHERTIAMQEAQIDKLLGGSK